MAAFLAKLAKSVRFGRSWRIAGGLLALLTVAAAIYWRSSNATREFELSQALGKLADGDFAPARRLARKLKGAPSDKSTFTLLEGAMLLARGHSLLAIDDLKQAAESPGVREPALLRLGEAWYKLGRHVEAQRAWEKALADNNDCIAAHRWLAASYYDLGAVTDAMEHLQEIARLDAKDPRPYRLLGLIHKDYERYDDAVRHYEESLRRQKNQPAAQEIREELAECLCRLQKHRQALVVLAECEVSTKVKTLQAECHHALGDLEPARKLLTEVLQAEPNELDALLLQGTIDLEEGNAAQAVAAFEKATHSHPKDYTAHFKLSQAYTRAGDAELAAEESATAERIRKIRKEFADLHQVAWNQTHDPEVRFRLAKLAGELDRPDLAEVWLKSARALLPDQAKSDSGDKP